MIEVPSQIETQIRSRTLQRWRSQLVLIFLLGANSKVIGKRWKQVGVGLDRMNKEGRETNC